jgi:hypothetical protein
MALEDGRYLSPARKQQNTDSVPTTVNNIVEVHPNFRVVALGNCVPPYHGRTLDPPLRSRFQSRFIDELSSESLIEIFSQPQYENIVTKKKFHHLVDLYESLRTVRYTLMNEGVAECLSGIPVMSLNTFDYCAKMLIKFPDIELSDLLSRCIPGGFWLFDAIPSRSKTLISSCLQNFTESSKTSITSTSIYSLKEIVQTSLRECQKFSLDNKQQQISPQKMHTSTVHFNTRTNQNSLVSVEVVCGTKLTTDKKNNFHYTRKGDEDVDNFMLLPRQNELFGEMLMDHACGKHICILGAKVYMSIC